jgi:hypothetical protein
MHESKNEVAISLELLFSDEWPTLQGNFPNVSQETGKERGIKLSRYKT